MNQTQSSTSKVETKARKKAQDKKALKQSKSSSLLPSAKSSVAFNIPLINYANLITPDTLMGDPFVYTCIKVLAESIASTPLEIYSTDSLTKAKDFYLYKILKRQANETQTPFEVLQWLLIDYYRYNYCIAACPRDENKKVIGIYPLPADKVSTFKLEDGSLIYRYIDFVFEESEIIKVVNFFDRGITGSKLTDLQKNILATSMATESFAGESFSKGTFPAGIAMVEDGTTLEELQELKQRFKEEFGGTANAGAVLMSSALKDYKPFSISNESAQMLDARKFNRSVIAGLFRVPAHLINDLEKATFSNVEHLDLSFVKHTLRPIAKNFEQRFNLTLLTDEEAEHYNITFNFDALMRGDFASRTDALCKRIQSGINTTNEVRALENLPPIHGGDTLRSNAALTPQQ